MYMNNLALFITPFTTLLFVNSVVNNSMDSFIMCGTFFLASIVRRNYICQNQKYQIPESKVTFSTLILSAPIFTLSYYHHQEID